MEQSNQNSPSEPEILSPDATEVSDLVAVDVEFAGWTESEKALLKSTEEAGFKPIAPTLAVQMSSLFVQGYSCAEIARSNKGFSEADILYCRKKFRWDKERDEYITVLTRRSREALVRQKMESIEFLTNTMSVMHKQHRDKMLRYLQTGNPEDLPEFQITSMKMYKEVIDTISKITGDDKDRVPKNLTQVNVNQGVVVQAEEARPAITQDLQSKLLRALAVASQHKVKPQE